MAAGWSPPPTVKVYYGKPMQPDVSRVLACLHEKDVEFKLVNMYEGQHMPPDLLRLQASERLPVPCLDDGSTTLFESRAICRYVVEKYADRGNKYLLGRDMLERASIEQWLKTEEQSFDPPSWTLFFHLAFSPLASLPEPDRALITENERRLAKVLDVYDQRLGESRYLAGNEFSLADLSHLPNSHYLARSEVWGHLFHSRKNVSRWWSKISNRPSWKEAVKILDEVGVLRELPPAHEATQQPSSEVRQPLHEKSPTSSVSAQPPFTIPDTPQPQAVSQSAQTAATRETDTKPSTEPALSNKPVPQQDAETDSKPKTQELKPAASAGLSGSTNTVSSSKGTSNGKSESTDVRAIHRPNPDALENLQSDSSTPAGAKSSSTTAQSIKKPSAPENEPIPLPATTAPTTKASPAQSTVGPNTQSKSETASNVKPGPTVTQKTNEPSQTPVVGARETPKSNSQENETNTPSAQSNPQNAASNARSDTMATQDNNQLNPNASQNPEQTLAKLPAAASDISADQSTTQKDKSTSTASGLATPSESNDKPNPERATSQTAALNATSETKATQDDNQLNQNDSKNPEKTSTKLSASALNTSANQPTPELDKSIGTASGLVTMSESRDKPNPKQTTSKTAASNAKSNTKATQDNLLDQNVSQNPEEPSTKLSAAASGIFADQSTSHQDKSTSTASGLGTTNEAKDEPNPNQPT